MYKRTRFSHWLCNLVEIACICGICLATLWSTAGTAVGQSPIPAKGYSNADLGFGYIFPGEMINETASARADIRSRAAAQHTTKILNLLLGMSSGPDAAALDWHLLSIETYPRRAFSDLDDLNAEAKMSAWVAGVSSFA